MSDKKSTERPDRKIQWAVLVIATLSVIVAFSGVSFQGISSYISSQLFPKADFTIESWTTPMILPSDFRESLSVSPKYYVATSVKLKSEVPYLGKPMQFSISLKNKGKKSVEQPRIEVYFVDYMYRAWNIWNKSLTSDVFAKGCSVEYHFPTIDQKTIGAWCVFVLLYDDAESVLVSYALKEFTVTDVAPIPLWQDPLTLVMIGVSVFGMVYYLIIVYRRNARLKREKEREAPSD